MSGSASFAYIEDRLEDSLLYKRYDGDAEDKAILVEQIRRLIREVRELRAKQQPSTKEGGL